MKIGGQVHLRLEEVLPSWYPGNLKFPAADDATFSRNGDDDRRFLPTHRQGRCVTLKGPHIVLFFCAQYRRAVGMGLGKADNLAYLLDEERRSFVPLVCSRNRANSCGSWTPRLAPPARVAIGLGRLAVGTFLCAPRTTIEVSVLY